MAVKSYGFAIGNLRAVENSLLKSADLYRLTGAGSVDALAAVLRDKGYGDGTPGDGVPALIKKETSSLWSYLMSIAPSEDIFEPFIFENDFHNLKAVMKGILLDKDYSGLLLFPVTVEPETIESAIREKKFDLLPAQMRLPAEESYSVLVSGGDAQLSDGIADAGCMTAQLDAVKKSGSALIKRIIEAQVFYRCFKVALRAAKTDKSESFLNDTLPETVVINKQSLKMAARGGVDNVLELLATHNEMSGAEAAECFKKSAGEFEKFCDDYVISIAGKCKFVTMGAEPLVGYLLAKTAELKTVRIIYSGIKTGQDEQHTKERLRELYG